MYSQEYQPQPTDMNTFETSPVSKVHHGRNIKHLREMLGVKQEFIAQEMQLTQQAVSKLEQKQVVEDELMHQVSRILDVPVDAIRNLDEDATTNFIKTYYDNHCDGLPTNNYPFNPIEKVVELYERLLTAEKEKVAILGDLLIDRK
jgi:transcriptional regulator with XRE-family HTH domain